jgi:phage FluMu protein gp41
MAEHTFKLIHGLKLGEETLVDVTIKDHLTGGELRAASEASEVLKIMTLPSGDQEPVLVISPSRMASETMRRQILSIGNSKGPISLAELDRLHEDDIAIMQDACNTAQKLKMQKEAEQRGRTDPAGDSQSAN